MAEGALRWPGCGFIGPRKEHERLPSIGEVAGWRVYVYAADHPLPHIHVRKAGHNASLSLRGEVLQGELPAGDLGEVQRWIGAHRAELLQAFNDVQAGHLPGSIK